MASKHDLWYSRVFSYPEIVEELLTAFVKKPLIKALDFTKIKKLNTKSVSERGNQRNTDNVFEVKYKGSSAFIYLFLEFQSMVDWFMAL
jgi:hypothetical protein